MCSNLEVSKSKTLGESRFKVREVPEIKLIKLSCKAWQWMALRRQTTIERFRRFLFVFVWQSYILKSYYYIHIFSCDLRYSYDSFPFAAFAIMAITCNGVTWRGTCYAQNPQGGIRRHVSCHSSAQQIARITVMSFRVLASSASISIILSSYSLSVIESFQLRWKKVL